MVLLNVKRGDEALFLYETPAATSNNDLAVAIATLHNTRLRLARLCMGWSGFLLLLCWQLQIPKKKTTYPLENRGATAC